MIVDVPAVVPVTMPELVPTVAIPVAPEVHVPPVVASLKVVVDPAHIVNVPVIDDGNGLTVTIFVAEQAPTV